MATTKQKSSSSSTTNTSSNGGSSSIGYGGSSSYGIGGSSSSTYGGSTSNTIGGSSSYSYGGSHSESDSYTNGHSSSISQGQSNTSSSNYGGSSGTSVGKTYSSGTVSDNTKKNYDKATGEYQQSDAVKQAYANLQSAISGKPSFQSQYEDKLSAMYDALMNREKFNYNFNEDQMYQQYKNQYTTQGRQAMEDTMGQAAKLSGGYGSSYAQSAGQQTYQNYLQELNNVIPELRNQAYQEYKDQGEEMRNQFDLTNSMYNQEYQQYRDAVSDWQSDRSYDYGMYSDERNFDYNKYQGDRNFWQSEYWNEKNAEQSNISQNNSTNYSYGQSNTNSTNRTETDSESQTHTSTDATNYSYTDTNSWSDTNSTNYSHTNSDNWNANSSTNYSNNRSTNYNNSTSNTNSTSYTTSKDNSVSKEANWTHNGENGGVNSASLVQQLYQVYKNEGSGGVDNALADLKQNGLVVGDTKYKFGSKEIASISSELRSTLDNIYRYSGGNQGTSFKTWLQ